MISIVIPLYDELAVLSRAGARLRELSLAAEIIFVDGGSLDRCAEFASRYGKVLHSKKNRATQMNYGATQASGGILLFLHADNFISIDTLEMIERRITQDGYIGGCLTQRLDNTYFMYRLIEWQGNARARLTGEFYGDQGIFVKKNIFLSIRGFPEVPLMEDVLFSRKLRTLGKTVVLSDKIMVSARRWEKNGIIKTTLFFSLIILLFWLRVPLPKIKQLYDDLR